MPDGAVHARAASTSEHSRTDRTRLPAAIILLAVIGACATILPFVGLGARVGWKQLPVLLASEPARLALGLSLRTCLLATTISVVLGVPLAIVLAHEWPGVRVARVLAVLPMTMPPVVAGTALLATLGKRGLLGPLLEQLGIQVSFTTAAVVIAQVFVSMPFLVVTLEAALRSRDGRPETIARTLGARPGTVLTRITLPLAAPALARGTALALGRSLGEFGATIAFAGSREGVTRTVPLAVYLERENDTPTALALAVALIVLSFLIVGVTTFPLFTRLPLQTRGGTRSRLRDRLNRQALEPKREGTTAVTSSRGRELRLALASPSRGVEVELTIPAGGAVGLVGPNGSGKSTVCEVAAGLLNAEAGEVRVGARLVDGKNCFIPAGRREVALLSQSPGLFPHLSVLDNVAFGPRCRGASRRDARERAYAELAAVGADDLAQRSGSRLSGGQAARVALARALATDPAVLVLDEPMAALDVEARQEMRRLIAHRARQQGLTLLLVTHEALDLTSLVDQIVVLESGRVVESGPTTRVLSTPRSRFAARLTGTCVLTGSLEDGEPALRLPSGTRITGRPEPQWEGGAGAPGLALVPPDAVGLYPRRSWAGGGSPRNALEVVVGSLERSGALVTVGLRTDDGQELSAVVTAGAVAELGIEPGAELLAVVKAVQVRITPARG
ncbi:ATP-binding cassette domain-containing protein [Actinomyces sp.]|uniref:ATP-binding cassette domain-containing protein n=1 Tax=Actinomyces sp. TaxID=29317 RepID=UPI0026DADAD1|nr:ATP-binding cassette domain-containing protein [Actinomyces sp.]MDO4901513.1 ATP-binding cassette domain-containing protein [Actinomyces sp.]